MKWRKSKKASSKQKEEESIHGGEKEERKKETIMLQYSHLLRTALAWRRKYSGIMIPLGAPLFTPIKGRDMRGDDETNGRTVGEEEGGGGERKLH